MFFEATATLWMLVAVQLFGLTIAWLCRLDGGALWRNVIHSLFFVSLAAVALTSLVCVAIGPGYCLLACGSLGLMVLGAVSDFSPKRDAVAW